MTAPTTNPHAGVVGWCHSCCTLQWGDDARWLPMSWDGGWHDWACINCDDEPWGLGVWTRSRPGEIDPASELGQRVTAGDDIYDLTPEQLDLLTHYFVEDEDD